MAETTAYAAVLPFRVRDGRLEVALVTAEARSGWGVPLGRVRPGESAREAAIRESQEESGLLGQLHASSLGTYRCSREGHKVRVELYPLRVQHEMSTWPAMNRRERAWLPADDALNRLRPRGLRSLVATWIERAPESRPRPEPAPVVP